MSDRWGDSQRDRDALDRHITGNYGEDQFKGSPYSPESECGEPVRGGGTCQLDPGHSGYHSTVVFGCDGCGATRRGYPHAYAPDGEYPQGLQFCFLCAGPPAKREYLRMIEREGV